jgi:hypothetical protein
MQLDDNLILRMLQWPIKQTLCYARYAKALKHQGVETV